MSWRLFNKFSAIGASSLGGISLYYLFNRDESNLKQVHNSWTTNFKPSVEWDSNWDHRASSSIVKPLSKDPTPEKENAYNEKLEKHRSKATRHIILIRHGQYNLQGLTDKERILTDLGRQQAKISGQRLAELKIPINEVVISTMTRAQETGKIILDQLSKLESIAVKNDSLIEEGAPIPPEPKVGHWRPEQAQFFQDGSRIEAGFRAHFHRAGPAQEKESYTLLVCHANVIRYFVCRALQFQPEAWLRMSLHHASLTWISIYPNGRVILRLLGDCGHMPLNILSTK